MAAEAIPTWVAHAEVGDNRLQGHSVAHELAGTESWLGIVVLGVTGRRLAAPERAMLDDLGVVMTVADPRIWPLKLGRLVASYGSTLAGLAAGTLAMDEALIGNWTFGKMAALLRTLRASVGSPDDSASVEAACRDRLGSDRRILGFGVSSRPVDERVEMLKLRVAERGRERLEYWTLFEHVCEAVFRMKGLRPNIASAAAAVCLDLGFDERETAVISAFIGLSDFLPNAAEGAVQMAPALQSLDAASIRYVGPPPRDSGRTSR
jgi:hypothetical protein